MRETKQVMNEMPNLVSIQDAEQIIQARLESFDEESVALLAERLEQDDYATPFEGLKDWHLLRAIAIHRPELTYKYHHLIDQEPFDEE